MCIGFLFNPIPVERRSPSEMSHLKLFATFIKIEMNSQPELRFLWRHPFSCAGSTLTTTPFERWWDLSWTDRGSRKRKTGCSKTRSPSPPPLPAVSAPPRSSSSLWSSLYSTIFCERFFCLQSKRICALTWPLCRLYTAALLHWGMHCSLTFSFLSFSKVFFH